MTKDEKEPKEKVNVKATEAASSETVNEKKEKNFHVTWNHKAKKVPFSLLVNDEALFSGKKPPIKFTAKGVTLVKKMFCDKKGGSTVNELMKAVLDSKYDEKRLGHFAFITGMTLGAMDNPIVKRTAAIVDNPKYGKKSKAFEWLQKKLTKEHGQLEADVMVTIAFGVYESRRPTGGISVEGFKIEGDDAKKLLEMLQTFAKKG